MEYFRVNQRASEAARANSCYALKVRLGGFVRQWFFGLGLGHGGMDGGK